MCHATCVTGSRLRCGLFMLTDSHREPPLGETPHQPDSHGGKPPADEVVWWSNSCRGRPPIHQGSAFRRDVEAPSSPQGQGAVDPVPPDPWQVLRGGPRALRGPPVLVLWRSRGPGPNLGGHACVVQASQPSLGIVAGRPAHFSPSLAPQGAVAPQPTWPGVQPQGDAVSLLLGQGPSPHQRPGSRPGPRDICLPAPSDGRGGPSGLMRPSSILQCPLSCLLADHPCPFTRPGRRRADPVRAGPDHSPHLCLRSWAPRLSPGAQGGSSVSGGRCLFSSRTRSRNFKGLDCATAFRDPAIDRLLLRCARPAQRLTAGHANSPGGPPQCPPQLVRSARVSAPRHRARRAAPVSTATLAAKSAQLLVGVRTPRRGNSQLTGGTISQGAHRGNQERGAELGMEASSGG
ncbi:hypothetical protein NDU88_008372 [Pleurodeles waltl]|uniref:Uncharacterized protein n=1 Tax=Pleurodeles waltl TaxID=8319 RepID=A0AAV7PRZ0_PLEWA|nr:hypothetical protein NDU88_008372 [Pleurodeles waltl]